jgi:hypothetical protein
MPSRSPNGSFTKNILSLAKPILPDLAYAVISPNCEIGVGIGIQRLRKFLTVNHIVMATDYPHFDSGYTARCPDSTAAGSPGIDLQRRENCVTTFVIGV